MMKSSGHLHGPTPDTNLQVATAFTTCPPKPSHNKRANLQLIDTQVRAKYKNFNPIRCVQGSHSGSNPQDFSRKGRQLSTEKEGIAEERREPGVRGGKKKGRTKEDEGRKKEVTGTENGRTEKRPPLPS